METDPFAEQIGCSRTVDYKSSNVAEKLAIVAENGVDLCFDNVGGETRDAAMDHLRPRARIILYESWGLNGEK